MANTVYENFYLSNEVEDQFKSHLDLSYCVTVDNSLTGTAGMKRTIHVYKATDGTEKLSQGQGNSKQIGVSYTSEDHEILLAQNDFRYFDEEAMKDPMLVPVGMKHAGTDLFNTINGDIYAEFNKTTVELAATDYGFGTFADAVAKLNIEELNGVSIFAFVCPLDLAKIRKALKETLQYVTAFAASGYVGTVAGVNIYTKKDATPGKIILGTKEAVTLFVKTGTEIEQDRDPNKRQNDIFSRKYYIAALTDESKAVKITVTEA